MKHVAVIMWMSVVAFVVGRLSAPEVPKMPKPGHIWVGFDPANRSTYCVNNGTLLKVHGFQATCKTTDRGTRFWKVMFEEETR